MKWLYNLCYCIAYPFVSLVYPHKTYGREHLPEGPMMICGNHSSLVDPVLVAFAATKRYQIHFMAKVELFRIPVFGFLMHKIGIFPVDREKGGLAAIKTAMRYLKNGEVVGIFPEGTRVTNEEDSEAKTGAIRIAMKTGVPVVPVYLPREKRKFSRVPIVIGTPYYPQVDKKQPTGEDYRMLAEELMAKINQLKAVIE